MNQIYFQPMINICHVSVIWVPSQPVLLIHLSYFNQFDSVFQPVRFGLCQRHSCICSCFSQSCAISANNICLSFSMKQVHLVAHSFALQSGHLHIWRVPEAHFTKKPWRLRWTGDVLLVHGFPSCSLSHHSSHVHLHFLFFLVPNPSPLHPLHPPSPPFLPPPPHFWLIWRESAPDGCVYTATCMKDCWWFEKLENSSVCLRQWVPAACTEITVGFLDQ